MQIDHVAPGMTLARDVYDPNGNVLIRAKTPLTERHLKAFRSWGIAEVPIASEEATDGGPARDPAALAEIRDMIDKQFCLSNRDHPAVEELYGLCLERAARRP